MSSWTYPYDRTLHILHWLRMLTPPDKPVQARDALTKTVPKARVTPTQVVMSTTGAQYDRWKQATSKELQAFLKTASKEPTRTSGTLFRS